MNSVIGIKKGLYTFGLLIVSKCQSLCAGSVFLVKVRLNRKLPLAGGAVNPQCAVCEAGISPSFPPTNRLL